MWGGSLGVYISLTKFQLDFHGRKGGSPKWGFLFILVGPIICFLFLGQYGIPWTQFWSLDVLRYVSFCKINCTF